MDREDVATQRRSLRARGRLVRSRIDADVRTDATATIIARLLTLPEIHAARRVLVTAATGDELDLTHLRTQLVARGAVVCLPVVDGDDLAVVELTDGIELRPGWMGVAEPVGPPATAPVDVVVVPALALDRSGGRLGYGGGHFDRFLAAAGAGATTVGAVFHDQLVDVVPTQPHDVTLDVVVTEHGVWRAATPDG